MEGGGGKLVFVSSAYDELAGGIGHLSAIFKMYNYYIY